MTHAPASLALRSAGVPDEPVHSMFRTLQEAEHHVSTAFGVSDKTYGGTERKEKGELPVAGIGQGNGAGPAGYVNQSSKYVEVLLSKGDGAILTAPISRTSIDLPCVTFDDDNDQFTGGYSTEASGEDLLPQAQKDIDDWQGCTAATGGAIDATKSYFWILDYKFSDGKWVYRSKEEMPGTLTVIHKNGVRTEIERLEVHEAKKTLGFFPAPDGNSKIQIEYFQEEVKKFTDKIRGRHSKIKNDYWIAMNTRIMKTLEYPRRATALSLKEWNQVMSPLLRCILPRTGIAKNFPHVIVYGPTEYQGLGLMHPWYGQELSHLEILWESASRPTLEGDILQQAFESLRMELGVPDSISDVPYSLCGQSVTNTWLKTLWASSQEFGFRIEDSYASLNLCRHEDQCLMSAFLHQGYGPQQLKILNDC